jgi:hypothetical protein
MIFLWSLIDWLDSDYNYYNYKLELQTCRHLQTLENRAYANAVKFAKSILFAG